MEFFDFSCFPNDDSNNSLSPSLHRESLASQLEASLTKADSEQLARSIAEEQYSSLEKEKIMKELEINDTMARHKQELGDKEATISSVRSEPGSRLEQMYYQMANCYITPQCHMFPCRLLPAGGVQSHSDSGRRQPCQ